MRRLVRAFAYTYVLAIISLLTVSLLWDMPVFLTTLLIFISGMMLSVWKSRDDLILYASCGITGALAEAFAIKFGAWTYAFPNIGGIPFWLPFLWGIAALFIKRISLEVHDFVRSRGSHSLSEIKSKI